MAGVEALGVVGWVAWAMSADTQAEAEKGPSQLVDGPAPGRVGPPDETRQQFAIFDIAEVAHQLDESNNALAALAAAIAVGHLLAAGARAGPPGGSPSGE